MFHAIHEGRVGLLLFNPKGRLLNGWAIGARRVDHGSMPLIICVQIGIQLVGVAVLIASILSPSRLRDWAELVVIVSVMLLHCLVRAVFMPAFRRQANSFECVTIAPAVFIVERFLGAGLHALFVLRWFPVVSAPIQIFSFLVVGLEWLVLMVAALGAVRFAADAKDRMSKSPAGS